MRVRVVVADQSEARFYDVEGLDGPLQDGGVLSDPSAHLHDRDLRSDRPGRVFSTARAAGARRGAVAHHATGGERTPRKQAARIFANRIATALQEAQQAQRFDRLVLMAAPGFLGDLRAALPKAVQTAVVAEVHKDLVHQNTEAVREHLPEEVCRLLR